MSGVLTEDAIVQWESATEDHIRQLAKAKHGVQIIQVSATKITQTMMEERRLRSLQEGQGTLRISFVANVFYKLDGAGTVAAADLVGDAFNREEDRALYLIRLASVNNPAFDNLNSVEVVVEGMTRRGDAKSKDSLVGIILGIVVGLVTLLVIIAYFLLRKRRRVSKQECIDSDVSHTEEASQQYAKEILVDEQDEISTLGAPIVAGVNFAGGEDEHTASVDSDYDVFKQKYRTQSSEDARPRSPPTESPSPTVFSSESKLAKVAEDSLLMDDASFEKQYEDLDRNQVEVEAPPGQLGIVIDTPNGDIPEIHAIKNDSALFGSVVVGDQLLSVDEEDVTSMSAVEVSSLISGKSKQSRLLVFYRRGAEVRSDIHGE